MSNVIAGLFSVDKLLAENKRIGEVPSTRQAYRDVITIALPSVIEMVLVSLVGSFDTMMIGPLGPEAIAAVGLTGQPRMLMLSIFFALNIGVTAVVGRRKGEDKPKSANEALRSAMVIIAVLSFVVMATVLPFSRQLMLLAGAQQDTLGMAISYFLIVSYVLPLNALTICINAAQRGIGNTRLSMYVNIISNAVNIVLNYLLIEGHFGFPALGVEGAAIATAIGFTVGFIVSLYSIASPKSIGRFLHVSVHDDWKIRKESIRAIMKVGGSAMFEQMFMRVGFFIYARLVADLGTISMAAHQVCMQFMNISFSYGDGVGAAGTSLVGQMLGKKRADLALLYGKISQRIALLGALFILSVIIALRYPLVALFTDDAEVIYLAARVMLLVAMFQPLQTSSVVISGALRGAGDTRYVAAIMLICVALIRPALTFISIHVIGLGLFGAWGSSIIDMAIRLTAVYKRFNSGKWSTIKV